MKPSDIKLSRLDDELKDLRAMAKKDGTIKKDKFETEFDNTSRVMKWIDKKVTWKKLEYMLNKELAGTRRNLFEFYKTESQLKLDNNAELNLFITSDDNYIIIEDKLQVVQISLSLINGTIDVLKARAWEMKEYASWQRFIHGEK